MLLADSYSDTSGIGHTFASLAALPFILGLFVWIVITIVAAAVAPPGRRLTFALLTFFMLGPLGVACASIANPRGQPVTPQGAAKPGWYPDGTGHDRYWDGTQWT